MIPKTIHYCWFGKGEMSPVILNCIESWKKYCPDYRVMLWNESNFDVTAHPFTKTMYEKKKWAFVADYVRLKILYDEGGIYLDTDMLLIKELTPLLEQTSACDLILAKESPNYINTAFMASTAQNTVLHKLLTKYDTIDTTLPPETIPIITTNLYESLPLKEKEGVAVLDEVSFYPFTQSTISSFNGHNAPLEAYGVHLYNFSWGTWYQKALHRTKLYHFIVAIITFLGIKKLLKKILRLS